LIGLVDRRTGKALSVTLWETAEDLQASNESRVLRDEEQRFASLLAAPPRREDYEVVANTMITHGPRMGWGNPFCRVTGASLHPEQWEDALALLTEQVIPAAKQERGFKGLISVADYSKGSSVTFSLWESIDDLEDSENSGYYQQQLARMARFMTELPTRETFELIVQAGQPDWVPWSAGN
jgi:heme-degrading monooxygenase HmoA